jgi:hypothetical protein
VGLCNVTTASMMYCMCQHLLMVFTNGPAFGAVLMWCCVWCGLACGVVLLVVWCGVACGVGGRRNHQLGKDGQECWERLHHRHGLSRCAANPLELIMYASKVTACDLQYGVS